MTPRSRSGRARAQAPRTFAAAARSCARSVLPTPGVILIMFSTISIMCIIMNININIHIIINNIIIVTIIIIMAISSRLGAGSTIETSAAWIEMCLADSLSHAAGWQLQLYTSWSSSFCFTACHFQFCKSSGRNAIGVEPS